MIMAPQLAGINGFALTPPQRRLLGGWRDILDDVRQLARWIEAMPDECRCGDGTAHLRGTCTCCCCQPIGAPGTVSCPDRVALLETTATQVDELVADTLRYFPAFSQILADTHPADVHDAADEVQHAIGALVRSFQCVCVTTEAFRDGCRPSHLPMLKKAAFDLHSFAERLDRLL